MTTPSRRHGDQDLAVRLATRAVRELAPGEIELIPATQVQFFARSGRVGRRSRDEPLGFGLDHVGELITPVALAAACAVLEAVRAEVAKTSVAARSYRRRPCR